MAFIDLHAFQTVPLAERPSKVDQTHLGQPQLPGCTFAEFWEALPALLGAQSLRQLVRAILHARRGNRPVVFALGGHVVKTGCAPYLVDLFRRGFITHLALNGAAAVHDVEMALVGKTSEEVDARVADGTFGAAAETAALFRRAIAISHPAQVHDGTGLGEGLGVALSTADYRHISLLRVGREYGRPCTVHVTIGTDVVHMHPDPDQGAGLGRVLAADFRTVCRLACGLTGGVWVNVGCSTLLPEVFLKAVAVAHNLGNSLDGLTTADLDMTPSYRPRTRLGLTGVQNLNVTGHHEILLPLLHQAVIEGLEGR